MALSAQRPPRAQPNPGWEENPEDWGCAPSGLVDGSKKCGEPVAGHLSLPRWPAFSASREILEGAGPEGRTTTSSEVLISSGPAARPRGPFPPAERSLLFRKAREFGLVVRACSSRCVQRGLGSQTLSLGSLEPSLSGPHSWPLSRPVTNVSYAAIHLRNSKTGPLGLWKWKAGRTNRKPATPETKLLCLLQVWTEEER